MRLVFRTYRSKMKKYGLQLRVPPSQQKKPLARPHLPTALGFGDDDEDDVEKEISRHASTKKVHKDTVEQHKKALDEDPSVFDYDGVYDEMKVKQARPLAQERQERKPKYIQALMEKRKEREREHEIIYEKKIAKDRSKDDHLYADKDKFVTSAYKKKLAEQAKWMEEERLRELREEKEDVTKTKDLTEFYFNLSKNVAFGAEEAKKREADKKHKEVIVNTSEERTQLGDPSLESARSSLGNQGEGASIPNQPAERSEAPENTNKVPDTSTGAVEEQLSAKQPEREHKRTDDVVSAAKERFLARKRAKEH